MNFNHPWAIGLGALAILLPIIVHFFTKPRPRSMPLSTIRFVQDAVKQKRKQSWLRDFLVVALRCLAIAAIAGAFAQPLFNSQQTKLIDESAKTQRVVILDSSQSMAATDSGVDGFQAARVQASRFLKSDTGLRANLILAGATPNAVFESPSANMNVLTDALTKASARPERIDIQAAINEASKMLTGDKQDIVRELIVVSDFQRTNWATVDFSALPESTKILLESTAPQETLANIGIVAVGFADKPTAGSTSVLEVSVGNFSAKPRPVKVEVTLGENVFVLQDVCPPNMKTLLSKEVVLQNSGWQSGWAKLLDNEDALPADDAYPFVAQTIDTPSCTLISLQSPRLKPSSSYFLQRALSPYESTAAGVMTVDRITPARFTLDAVAGSQLLIFDHPGKLTPAQIKSVASLIRRGRAVMYVASESVDATNLSLLSKELGSDLRAPVEMVPPSRGNQRKSLSVGSVKQKRRPFSIFGDSLTAMLGDLKIAGGLESRRVPNSLDDDILATLSDRSVLLYSTPAGLGNLCVLNVDLNQSNWPRHPTFVPVLSELVTGLLRANSQSQLAFCGEPLTRLLPASVSSPDGLVVESLTGDQNGLGQFQSSGEGVVWNWREPMGPGVYQVKQAAGGAENEQSGTQTTNDSKRVVYALASNLSAEESDLRSLRADVLTDRLAGGREVSFHRISETKEANDRSWIWFAVLATVALIGEVIALKAFKT